MKELIFVLGISVLLSILGVSTAPPDWPQRRQSFRRLQIPSFDVTTSEDPDDIFAEIFTSEKDLEPEQTEKLLKKLAAIYKKKKQPVASSFDESLDEFLELSNKKLDNRCDPDSLVQVSVLVGVDFNQEEMNSPSMDRYVKKNAARRYKQCSASIRDELKGAILREPEVVLQSMGPFKEGFVRGHLSLEGDVSPTMDNYRDILGPVIAGKYEPKREALGFGLLWYMRKQAGLISPFGLEWTNADDTEPIEDLFESSVIGRCKAIHLDMLKVSKVFQSMFIAMPEVVRSEQVAWDWVASVELCRFVISNKDSAREAVAETWRERTRKSGRFGGL